MLKTVRRFRKRLDAEDSGDFSPAERRIRILVPIMCSMTILMLGDDYTKYDYILDDIR
ncbi:MAG: hypothetical protein IJS39_11780 [Synergistaceae bacterium]|nr:hypothetical protein [Synergistaceae bacterium]